MRLQEQSCDFGNGDSMRFSQNGAMTIEWIREGLKKPGKTQAGLARALKLDPAAISRLLDGKRQLKLSEIETVKAYLGESFKSSEPAEGIPLTKSHASNDSQELLEVRGMAEGGPDGWNLWNGEIVQYIQRPDNLRGVPNAYAVYVTGHSMEPRYCPGEICHIHPGRPVLPGAYVLVQRKPLHEGEPPLAILKRLVRRSGSKVTLEQLNPPQRFDVPAGEVVSIHRVVGASEA